MQCGSNSPGRIVKNGHCSHIYKPISYYNFVAKVVMAVGICSFSALIVLGFSLC